MQQVVGATDIVDIIASYVMLKSAGGGRMKGLCPFHTEKTPSFTVDRHRQMYHCFGCGKGGDVLDFVRERDGLAFTEALQQLADRARITLPAISGASEGEQRLRERLLAFGTFALDFYRQELKHPLKGSSGRSYIQSRQLNSTTLERFGLGFAPDGWSNLLEAARKQKFEDAVLQASGMFKTAERGGGMYDFFRNRVMIPIRDVSGKVVAFGGRDLSGETQAKYINSPETMVYKKSQVLYGLHEARDAMRRENQVLLVEGYFDLMRCVDAGIHQVVASCGTALTQEQAMLIKRYVPEVVLVYDGDAAGVKAAVRGAGVLAARQLTVRAMALPDGLDPDDYIRLHGADAFRTLVKEADDFVTFHVKMSAERSASIEGRRAIAQDIFEILADWEDALRTEAYLNILAGALKLNPQSCHSEFSRFRREQQQGRNTRLRTEPAPERPVSLSTPEPTWRDDCDFLAALLGDAALWSSVRNTLAMMDWKDGPLGAVINAMLAQPALTGTLPLEDDEARRLYAAAVMQAGGQSAGAEEDEAEKPLKKDTGPSPAELVERRINRLRREELESRLPRIAREIQEAEYAGDDAMKMKLFMEQLDIKRKMEQIGAV